MEHRCLECGEAAAEPRLKYCENCGAKMPEFKPPPLVETEGAEDGGGAVSKARVPKKSTYTGPKWLEHVPAHSPTVLGVILHLLALGLSILPTLAGPGPFWSFVMVLGVLPVVAREYRLGNEPNPLVDWVPESFSSPSVVAAYASLSVALVLPMLEFSIQPLLWIGGTLLVMLDQWYKVFAHPEGVAPLFEPRQLIRGQRVLALAGIAVCLLSALIFTWVVEGEVAQATYRTAAERVRAGELRPAVDSVYGGAGGLKLTGMEIPFGSTVEVGLLAILVMLMLKPEVDRPVWLRFVPAGVTVISLAWVLVNMGMKVGPILFLAGLLPVGLVSAMQAIGRDDLLPADDSAEPPPPDPGYEGMDGPTEDGYPPEYVHSPPEDEDMRG
ncbi:hypothetical protein [Hyalangium minutum]|uniref:Zinc ribbon domain-containing protein n=1 Tax=Hyalangium minutum TaxID=394096 RepID=A0A085WG63_9BACT|nr:hypothetical protein [Hyalangium minutum]KFE66676.1 hypothetical protein DB31_8890 [Hyalangium minutum]